ncbi:hypothetical protein CL629_01030 [bacterium]|nr:hypothetical protein [bacterium]
MLSLSIPLNLAASFDEENSVVDFSWASSTDSDTLDNLITYEVAHTTSTDLSGVSWSSVGSFLQTSLDLGFGETYLIGVRAKDDFENVSDSTEIFYDVPVPELPLTISNVWWGYVSSSAAQELSFEFSNYDVLVSSTWTVAAFYLNSIVPDKGPWPTGLNNLLNDGEEKIWVRYQGCFGSAITTEFSLAGDGASCAGDVRNSYDPSGVDFPEVGEVVMEVSPPAGEESHSSEDYITILFLSSSDGSNFQQVGRYPVPIYFTE